MQRVRVIQEPLSDYVRFELTWAYPINTSVGEQIHVLSTAPGQPAVRNEDFWLFDDTTVARLRYDEDGRFLRAEIVTERDAVTRYCHLRDELLARAIPLEQYMALAWSS
jgi:hypothetical protein